MAGCVAWLGPDLRLFLRPFRLPLGALWGPKADEWEGNHFALPRTRSILEPVVWFDRAVSHPLDASARPSKRDS